MSPTVKISLPLSEELFVTSNVKGATLFDAMKDATRARGFVAVDPGQAIDARSHARLISLSTGNGKTGARVRADLGTFAQPVAAAAARAMGVPVTIVVASGTVSGVRGKLTIALAVRAVQVDRTGKARALRVEASALEHELDFEQEDTLDWTVESELLRAGYDHAGNVLGEAARGLNFSLEADGQRVVQTLRRPSGTPRVEELASLVSMSTGHELLQQADGRFMLKVTLGDGKRMAYLSAAEATELKQLLAR